MLPIAILCGGKGTRIASIAGDLPKALVPVAGTPFLGHQLRRFSDSGIREVVLLVGYRSDLIRGYVGDGSAFGIRVRYHDDGDVPLGTAGAVRAALPLLGQTFLTAYGDALTQVDIGAVAAQLIAPYDGVMTVYRNDDRWLPSNVRLDGEYVDAYDKQALPGSMTHIDYGINAFRAAAFSNVAEDRPVDLAEVHREMIERRSLRAFPVAERWYEIGSPEGLASTERFVASMRRIFKGKEQP